MLAMDTAEISSVITISSTDDDDDDDDRTINSSRKRKSVIVKNIFKTKPPKLAKLKKESCKNKSIKKTEDIKKSKNKSDSVPKNTEKSNTKTKFCSNEQNGQISWSDSEWLAENQNIDIRIAQNILDLYSNGNSIPFIARYRRDATGNMSPEDLYNVKESYEKLQTLKKKIQTVTKTIESQNKMTKELKNAILNTRSIEELDHIYAPFKPGAKKTLAERAKNLGLEEAAMAVLNGVSVNLLALSKSKQLDIKDVEDGVVHIISYIMAHDTVLIEYIRKNFINKEHSLFIESKPMKTVNKAKPNKNVESKEKFEDYFNFRKPVKYVKSHQVLALNRGENLKILSVKVVLADQMHNQFKNFCLSKWVPRGFVSSEQSAIVEKAIDDAYKRFVQPLVSRQVRNNINNIAEKESIKVFANNLKNLLLTKPFKGRKILGIDPGFKNGCKLALISETGALITSGVIYPFKNSEHKKSPNKDLEALKIKNILEKNNCHSIALGNGTACRETEEWLTHLLENNFFVNEVSYTIVSENGASIYSCTSDAKKEFPNVDTNIVSAISIARRLQDPLAELIKIEPKHLGVGMYQHDVKGKQLSESLDNIVVECVSFVGIDLNTTSKCLLCKVAGLDEKRAENILKFKDTIGFFKHRYQIKDVKGIGDKIFEQCAGFLRIGPLLEDGKDEFYNRIDTNPLDRTWIHPESYNIADRLIEKCSLNKINIGSEDFIKRIDHFWSTCDKNALIEEMKTTKNTMQLIVDALIKPIDYDLRFDNKQGPVFRKGITKITDLKIDTILTGAVQNVTQFGSFVDIGVGKNGLIHVSKMNGFNVQLGDKVEVKVLSLDIPRERIGLQLITILK